MIISVVPPRAAACNLCTTSSMLSQPRPRLGGECLTSSGLGRTYTPRLRTSSSSDPLTGMTETEPTSYSEASMSIPAENPLKWALAH
jgi:hypothetical protein